MPWESRGRGRYFYTTRRRGRKVEKVYHGKGIVGNIAAGLVAQARQKKADLAAQLVAEQARVATLDWAMTTLDDVCELMLEATLYAKDFHNFNGHWRRRRVGIEDRKLAEAAGRGRGPEPVREGQER
jgi:hypothetical protein